MRNKDLACQLLFEKDKNSKTQGDKFKLKIKERLDPQVRRNRAFRTWRFFLAARSNKTVSF